MNARKGAAVVALAIAVSIGWLVLRGAREAPPTLVANEGAAPKERAAQRTAPSSEPPAGGTRFRPGARHRVPRFAVAGVTSDGSAAPASHPRRLHRGGDAGLEDRRPPDERHNSGWLKAELHRRLEQARAAVDECLERWPAEDEALKSGVMLAIEMDRGGLDDVYFEDVEGIPEGPLACIARSVYPVDWAGLTPTPLKVTWKLRYEADGGA